MLQLFELPVDQSQQSLVLSVISFLPVGLAHKFLTPVQGCKFTCGNYNCYNHAYTVSKHAGHVHLAYTVSKHAGHVQLAYTVSMHAGHI